MVILFQVRLESIGAEDIVDGNPRLILGLIWTIILRFQIQEIEIDVVSMCKGRLIVPVGHGAPRHDKRTSH
jgi:hypothetical protein